MTAFGPFVQVVDQHDGFGEAVEDRTIGERGAVPVVIGLGGWI
jgi:hypothetical protein